MTVWATPRGAARHDVRIKVNRTHGRQMVIVDAATVGVRPAPRLIAGQLSSADLQAVGISLSTPTSSCSACSHCRRRARHETRIEAH
jgi:methylmalonyl-CoA mutase cobalamin-binding subunit